MDFTGERQHDDGVVERTFVLGEVPGILWTPPPTADPSPLILLGHPGGLPQLSPRLSRRARHYASVWGFAAATLELPGSGDRPRLAPLEAARAELRQAMASGEPVGGIVDRLILPLVDLAVPEWQAAIGAVLALPGIGGPVGHAGGPIAIGLRLALVEPRLRAAVLFAGSFVPAVMVAEARRVTIPL